MSLFAYITSSSTLFAVFNSIVPQETSKAKLVKLTNGVSLHYSLAQSEYQTAVNEKLRAQGFDAVLLWDDLEKEFTETKDKTDLVRHSPLQ